jgi:hypothetical protein
MTQLRQGFVGQGPHMQMSCHLLACPGDPELCLCRLDPPIKSEDDARALGEVS